MRQYPPMLAKKRDEPFDSDAFLFEVKWDGYRAMAYIDQDATLMGRGSDLTHLFPSVIADLTSALGTKAVVDGEVIALDRDGHPNFHLLRSGGGQTRYMAFDLLWVNGQELINLPLRQRRDRLASLLKKTSTIQLSEAIPTRGRDLYKAAAGLGLEGIMAKRSTSIYQPGERSDSWLKIVVTHQEVFGVLGYHVGPGGTITSLELTKDNVSCGRVAAPADRWLGPIKNRNVSASEGSYRALVPGLACRVKYRELTPGGKVRHATFVAFANE